MAKYFCKNCRRELSDPHMPCPNCKCRDIILAVEDTMGLRESIELKQKRPGFKSRRPVKEIQQGWFQSKDIDGGVNKSRIIDRESDEYHEIVKEYKTGKVIHEKHEPLRRHRR